MSPPLCPPITRCIQRGDGRRPNHLVANVGLLAVTHPLSVNGAWSGSGGGSWNTAANWQGSSVPGNSGDTAAFGTAIGSARATVTLDGSRTLAALAFNTSGGGSYTISRSSGDTTSTLTLTNTSGTVSIADSGGNQTIAVPVVLGSNLSVSATAGSSLTISAPVSQANAGTSVTLTGGGTLILSGSNTYTGGTTISGGTLEVANAAALPAKGIINVGRSGTVNLTALLVLPATAETSADEAPSDTSANEASLAEHARRHGQRHGWRGCARSGRLDCQQRFGGGPRAGHDGARDGRGRAAAGDDRLGQSPRQEPEALSHPFQPTPQRIEAP